MAKKHPKTLIVLHVEDDDNDVLLLARACDSAKLPVEIHRVIDGKDAKAYLLGTGHYVDRFKYPLPHIVVLDLKMPRVDGFELLTWLRAKDEFSKLPVLVFTASISREDKARALASGATSYFVKPTSFSALVQMVQFFKTGDANGLN